MADPNSMYGRSASQELSMSEEVKYKKKCRDLKRRIGEIETSNESLVTKLARTKRFIQRVRLERAFLLEKLEENAPRRLGGSEGSPSPPASPSLEAYSLETLLGHKDNMGSPGSRRSNSPSSRQHSPSHDGFGNSYEGTNGGSSKGRASDRLSPAPASSTQ